MTSTTGRRAETALMTIILSVIMLLACSCSRTTSDNDGDATALSHATLLRISDDNGDYIAVDIVNPWDTAATMCRLALVPRDRGDVDTRGRQRVDIPVRRSIVTSSIHAAAIDSLGSLDAVSGVTDAMYIKQPALTDALADGRIANVGPSTSPSLEKIIAMQPEVVLATPYENAGYGVIEQSGAVIIPCADYMEQTPLGRAEWIKLLGLLYGAGDKARDRFDDTLSEYEALCAVTSGIKDRKPKVIKEMMTGGVWYVPAGESYQARLLADAGGDYPWAADKGAGSLQLDFAAVYDRAADADVWIVQCYDRELTLSDLADDYPLNSRIKAYADGGVYSCNTARSMLYEDTPFSPQLLLREYINIIHPGLLTGDAAGLRYYKRVE